jgi:hypothetical protein
LNQTLKSNLGLVHSTLIIIPGFLFLVLIENSFFSRWGTFLAFSALAFFWIISLNSIGQNQDISRQKPWVMWIPSVLIYTNILILFIKNILNFRANALGTEFILITALIVLGLFALTWDNFKSFKPIEMIRVAGDPFFQLAIFIWVALSFSRLVEYQVKYFSANNFRYILICFGLLIVIKSILDNRIQITNKVFYTIFLLTLAFSFLFAFRSDSINQIEGSGFHWGYYTGVINSIKSGGTLLYDTPSQYGFLNLLLPSFLAFESNRQSFYIFQSILFIIIFILLSIIFYQYSHRRISLFLLIITFLSFYFADPELIGPQLYPSSSLVRFFPSLLILLWFFYLDKTGLSQYLNRKVRIVEGLLLLLNALWSFESFLYSLFILFFAFIFRILHNDIKKILSFYALFLSQFLLSLISFLLLYYLLTSKWPDLNLFLMYSLKYAQGFGSYPLSISSPIWIFPIIVLFIIILKKLDYGYASIFRYSSLGALLGWSTYFIGRSVPDNIIALTPELVSILILNYMLTKNVQLKRFVALPIAIYFFILSANIILNPTLVNKLVNLRLYSSSISNPINASPELAKVFNSLDDEYKNLPIVYNGHLGLLPNVKAIKISSLEKTWLPAPSALLQEPIPPLVQKKILERFILNNKFEKGLLILDKQNSFPERYVELKSNIANFYSCTKLIDTDEWLFELCDKQF